MRLRLAGYPGDRPPIPTGVGGPGGIVDPDPGDDDTPPEGSLIVVLEHGVPFLKSTYLAMGYNRFEVMCIGAAGGRGGGWYQHHNGGQMYVYGGGGGGGGLHRIKGKLALLPASVPVVVGAPGADAAFIDAGDNAGPGVDDSGLGMYFPPPSGVVVGVDGGASSFNTTTCRASGGKGGDKADTRDGWCKGGKGGIGNSLAAGGGIWYAYGEPGYPGGRWDGIIGSGGPGGLGGRQRTHGYPFYGPDPWTWDTTGFPASDGVRGSYSSTDSATSGPGGLKTPQGMSYQEPEGVDRYTEYLIIPGAGGGATTFPLDGGTVNHGSKAGDPNGLVIIKLTAVTV